AFQRTQVDAKAPGRADDHPPVRGEDIPDLMLATGPAVHAHGLAAQSGSLRQLMSAVNGAIWRRVKNRSTSLRRKRIGFRPPPSLSRIAPMSAWWRLTHSVATLRISATSS